MTQRKKIKQQDVSLYDKKRRSNDAIAFYNISLPLINPKLKRAMTKQETWANRIVTILTLALAIINWLLLHLPKSLVLLLFICSTSAIGQTKFRTYPFYKVSNNFVNKQDKPQYNVITKKIDSTYFFIKDSDWFLCPTVNFNAFTYHFDSNKIDFAPVPGIGYGIHYKQLIALSIFTNIEQAIINKAFAIQLIPTLQLLDYINIGYGYEILLKSNSKPKTNRILIIGCSLYL